LAVFSPNARFDCQDHTLGILNAALLCKPARAFVKPEPYDPDNDGG
jgi:hypothetical protein